MRSGWSLHEGEPDGSDSDCRLSETDRGFEYADLLCSMDQFAEYLYTMAYCGVGEWIIASMSDKFFRQIE